MRNEDYDRELLLFITLFCVVFATAVGVVDASPPAAKTTQNATRIEQPALAPVRTIGTPFVPNTNPSLR